MPCHFESDERREFLCDRQHRPRIGAPQGHRVDRRPVRTARRPAGPGLAVEEPCAGRLRSRPGLPRGARRCRPGPHGDCFSGDGRRPSLLRAGFLELRRSAAGRVGRVRRPQGHRPRAGAPGRGAAGLCQGHGDLAQTAPVLRRLWPSDDGGGRRPERSVRYRCNSQFRRSQGRREAARHARKNVVDVASRVDQGARVRRQAKGRQEGQRKRNAAARSASFSFSAIVFSC